MNRRPLTSLERKESNHPLQARLEKLPFKPGSVDLMFLDFTLLFMNPIQVHNFFDEARKVLSENGLVLATYYNPGNACPLDRLENRKIFESMGIPTYYFEEKNLHQLAQPLKSVFNAEFKNGSNYFSKASLAVFAQPSSKIPEDRTISKIR